MKALLLLLSIVPLLAVAAPPVLPLKLAEYEASLSERFIAERHSKKAEGTIAVIIAYGQDNVVREEALLRLQVGATASDAATLWFKQKRGLLIGWVQGMVVAIHVDGSKIQRTTWSQREAREAAKKYVMQDGDTLIALVYGDY